MEPVSSRIEEFRPKVRTNPLEAELDLLVYGFSMLEVKRDER